jgi:hypothetical protein
MGCRLAANRVCAAGIEVHIRRNEMFEQNVGLSDRAVRTLSGLFLIGLIFMAPEAPLRWFGLIGIVPLLTGVVGTCPFYALTGKTTCPSKEKAKAN